MNTILPTSHELDEMFSQAGRVLAAKPRIIVSPQIRSAAMMKQDAAATEKLLDLIELTIERLFGGDMVRVARWLGYSDTVLRWVQASPRLDRRHVLVRSDIYDDQGQPKMLELNLGSSVGGLLEASFHSILLKLPSVREAVRKQEAEWLEPLSEWAWLVVRSFLSHYTNPLMAFVESDFSMPAMQATLNDIADRFHEITKTRVTVCTPKELERRKDGLYARGEKVDVIYRLFDLEDLQRSPSEFEHILDALEDRLVEMPMGFSCRIAGSKALFALLSDPAYQTGLSVEDTEWVRRHIPETRLLTTRNRAYALRERERLLIKPADGYGGAGIICGWEASEAEWGTRIASYLSSASQVARAVVQERITPSTGPVVIAKPGGAVYQEQASILWGCYLFGNRHIGHVLRTKEITESSVINYANGAAIGPVFYSEERERTDARAIDTDFMP
ncbi:hypothetical protein MKX50_08085 [Paenibacillus sp. FSL W8-0186]|uniref:hypothetical protein n=1 Tax=Paenibacillus sp. FSL W8-0186 TaxID=2921709 RepID=UPI0030D19993